MRPPRVSTRAELSLHLGTVVLLAGTSEEAKAGPVVLVEREPVYVAGLARWSPTDLRRHVEVRGVLRRSARLPPGRWADGAPTSGADADQWWLEDAHLEEPLR